MKVQTSRLNQTLSPSTQKEPKRPRSSLGSSALSRSSLSRSTPQLVQTTQTTPLRKISRPLNDDLNYKGKIKTAKSISNLSAKQRRKRLKPDDVRATRDETGITIWLIQLKTTLIKLISRLTSSPSSRVELETDKHKTTSLKPSKSMGNLAQQKTPPKSTLSVFDRLYATKPNRKPKNSDSLENETEVF